jgi:Fe-S cluster assembly protein SufD
MTEIFAKSHEDFIKKVGSSLPTWFVDVHHQAYESFKNLGLPTTRDESWKYTSLRALENHQFHWQTGALSSATLDVKLPSQFINLVFVNGALSEQMSSLDELSQGVEWSKLADLASSNDREFARLVGQLKIQQWNPFSALNQAFTFDGWYLKVKQGIDFLKPVMITHVIDSAEGREVACFPKVFVELGRNSRATVIERFLGRNVSPYFMSPSHDYTIGEGARLNLYRLFDEEGYHVSQASFKLAKDALLECAWFNAKCGLGRHNINVDLNQPGAEAHLSSLYTLDEKEHLDFHIEVNHNAPNTASRQFFKGVLDGSGHAVFDGKIKVKHDASKSDAQQLSKNLLLSSDARVDAKPQLEIDTDDVKCSHGAAIGQLDSDELFYLLSRGISSDQAHSLLKKAFVQEVLEKVSMESVKNYITAIFDERI